MDFLMVFGSILASFSTENPYQTPYKNQCLFYSKNHRNFIRKLAHFGGVQRTSFSLPEPLLDSAWRPRGPQNAPEEAQTPPREPKAPKSLKNHRKIIENPLKNHWKIIEKSLKQHWNIIENSIGISLKNQRNIIENSLENHWNSTEKS